VIRRVFVHHWNGLNGRKLVLKSEMLMFSLYLTLKLFTKRITVAETNTYNLQSVIIIIINPPALCRTGGSRGQAELVESCRPMRL